MGCVARPRWNRLGECTFNGKIENFPFTKQVATQRASKNRPKGVLETKPISSINKEATRKMLITQIIPAIKLKWPNDEREKVIFIQQDNCKAHITQDDEKWQAHHKQDDFTFILTQQTPNSLDCNLLDLDFFG